MEGGVSMKALSWFFFGSCGPNEAEVRLEWALLATALTVGAAVALVMVLPSARPFIIALLAVPAIGVLAFACWFMMTVAVVISTKLSISSSSLLSADIVAAVGVAAYLWA